MFLYIAVFCLIILYFFFDVHYFLRVIFTYSHAKYLKKKIPFMTPASIYGICMLSDIDFMLTHMNNSRFLREFDFSRFDYLLRVGLLDYILKRGGIPVSAVSIRYRLPLMLFSPYKVVTAPVWWDSKFLYLDQRIVTLSDDIVRSVAYVKLAIVKIDFEDVLKKFHPDVKKPEMPEDLKKWIESNEISSANMKKAR